MPSARFQGREFNRFRDEENIGLLKAKHPYFWGKTSELCLKEVRCFDIPENLSCHPSPKYVFVKNPTFLHPLWKPPLFPGIFRCRIRCRMAVRGCRFRPQTARFRDIFHQGTCKMPQLRAKCLRLYRRISQTDQLKHLNNTGKKYGQKVQKKRNPHPASPQEREEASGADYPFAGMQDNISCHHIIKKDAASL